MNSHFLIFLPINTLRQNGLYLMIISILTCKLGILNPTSQGLWCRQHKITERPHMLFGMEHAWRGVTFLLTLCSLHIYLMFVSLQALCLTNHMEDVPACPQRACGLERKVRCTSRWLLMGLEEAQEIAALFLAELGARRLREWRRWILENTAWICQPRAPTDPSVRLWVDVPKCRNW